MNTSTERLRLGILSYLVRQASNPLGRTSVMKMAYLLQTVKGMPLEYDFRLYAYGPFDSDVLNDLDFAGSVGAVKSQMITFPSGYGYEFTPGPNAEMITEKLRGVLASYEDSLRWVLNEFGSKSATDLELLTTIIYADREATYQRRRISLEELVRKVWEIKPHFTEKYIEQNIKDLSQKGLLKALEVMGQAG
jgi:uncharacterized protein YwgA